MTPVYKLSASSIKGRTNYGSMLAGNTAFVQKSYESIATVSVGSGGSSTITFSSIPSTYTHLQIRAILKQSIGSGAFARFNSDTGSNYARHRVQGTRTTASATGDANQDKVLINTSQGFSDFGAIVMDILDYANTNKYKTERHLFGIDSSTSGAVGLESNLWRSTSAITQIEFISPNGGNYDEYSHFALYGIKSA